MVTLAEITDFVDSIASRFHPDQVILFGSMASGTATEDSDVDLLVLMPFEGRATEKAIEIVQADMPSFALDLLVRDPADVRWRISQGDFFLQEIMEEGIVLYDKAGGRMGRQGRGRLPNSRARTPRPKTSKL